MPKSQGVEIPIARDRHNKMMLALFVLLKLHPEARIGIRQSKSILVARTEEASLRISQDARTVMMNGNQFLNPEDFAGGIERFIAQQDGFMRANGLDPETQAQKAQKELYERRQRHDAVNIGSRRIEEALVESKLVDAAAQELTAKNIEEAVKTMTEPPVKPETVNGEEANPSNTRVS